MKKTLFFAMGLCSIVAFAQSNPYQGRVGINTETPSASMNIKSKDDAQTPKNLELENQAGAKLVTVLNNGNVGIDTQEPTQKLDVNGNARVRQLTDATTQESTYTKAVVADADGNLAVVSRTTPTLPNSTQTVFGKRENVSIMEGETFYSIQQNNSQRGDSYFRYAGQSITLPPGKWVVYCGFLAHYNEGIRKFPINITYDNNTGNMNVPYIWLRGALSDNANNERNPTRVTINGTSNWISAAVVPNTPYTMTSGLWLVDNNTNADKTYYLKVSINLGGFNTNNDSSFGKMGAHNEEYMIAIRRQ